jgi:hypothetical protein
MGFQSRRAVLHATTLYKRMQPRGDRGSQELQRNLKRNKNLKATRMHALWAK